MKKLILIVLVMATMIAPISALAANEDAEPQPSLAGDLLVIDGAHAYPGMTATYSNGYAPRVANGIVTVTLPLIQNAAYTQTIANNTVTASLNLGSDATSPFALGSYQQSVSLGSYDFNGAAQQAYLVSFQFPCVQKYYINGRYPFAIDVSYVDSDGTAHQQTFSFTATISDGKNPEEEATPSPTPEAPASQPKVIVSKYTINPEVALAGEGFTVSVTLKNTSKSQDVKNIVVSYKGETADLIPASATNTFYIDSIGTEEEFTFDFDMTLRADTQPAPQKVILEITYEDENANALAAGDELLVQIKQTIRTKFDDPQVSSEMYIGDSAGFSLNIYNLGKNTLYNVMVNVEAPGIITEGGSYLGNMESGTQKTAEIYGMVEGPEGEVTGKLVVTYEDEYGDAYTEEIDFTTYIMPMPDYSMDMPMEEEPLPEESGPSLWIIIIIIAAAGAAAIIIAVVLARKRKARAQAALLDDEDDDDIL